MTEVAQESCRVEGVEHLEQTVASEAVCELFQRRLASRLEDPVHGASRSISIEISKSGTIDASVTDPSGASVTPFPTVSIDVMDRGLKISDIEQLADAVAQAMTANSN